MEIGWKDCYRRLYWIRNESKCNKKGNKNTEMNTNDVVLKSDVTPYAIRTRNDVITMLFHPIPRDTIIA